MSIGADRYTYRVFWSEEDEQFVGLCAEFSLLSHLDDTADAAFAGIRDLVAFCVADLREEGAPLPEPLSARRYSGTLTLRARDGRRRSWRQHESPGRRTSGPAPLDRLLDEETGATVETPRRRVPGSACAFPPASIASTRSMGIATWSKPRTLIVSSRPAFPVRPR